MPARVRSNFALKAVGITAFMTIFFVAYFHLLNHPRYPVTSMPLTWVDTAIPFFAPALPIYASLWLYVSLAPTLIDDRRALIRYGWVIAAVLLTGLGCFLLWPTAVPPLATDWQGFPGAQILDGIDAAGNACPSMHVASAVFSGIWLQRVLREMRAPGWALHFNLLWGVAIVWSTMAIRQHVFLDVAGGLVLGVVGVWALHGWQRIAERRGRD